MNEIERWYDKKYDEWERLERHKIEVNTFYILDKNYKSLNSY